ncbi:MAG: HNH endonuclease [Oscillospiraceae bacterium]|jgi:5-methylcytosine-specific restriction endonuclease McrA|nr:HNH endonuclease [Oscillospiraceae bacterium]
MNANISKALRNIVFERDSYTCILCNNAASDAHHFVPRSRGGRDIPENLVALCHGHHMAVHGSMNLTHDERRELECRIIEYLADYYVADFYEAFQDTLNK